MKYLILLNRKFPYKYGESFLENEIDVISPYFDRILIFPSDMKPDDTVTRKIRSSNVSVHAVAKTSLRMRNIGWCLRGIFEKKDPAVRSLKQWLYSGYFNCAARSQANDVWNALKEISFNENDEVTIYSYWLFINAKSALLLKDFFPTGIKLKCISRAHSFDIYEHLRYLPERNELFSGLDAIFPCSDYGTAYLQERYPEYANKLFSAKLGTSDSGIQQGKESDIFRIVSCSRTDPPKRLDLMIDALKLLCSDSRKYSWTHIGGGEELEHLKKRSSVELDFMSVTFTGRVNNTEVYERYRSEYFDLFLNTSIMEGLPVSIMEATSFGIPVVATDVGGTSEIVIDSVNGKLLKSNPSPIEIAEAIRVIASLGDAEYEMMRLASRQVWEKEYNAAVNYKKFAGAIASLHSSHA